MRLLFILLSFSLNAQETVYHNKTQSLVRFVINQDTSYAFYYKNEKYNHITDVKYVELEDPLAFVDSCLMVLGSEKQIALNQMVLSSKSNTVYLWHNGSYCYIKQKTLLGIKESL